MEVSKWHTKTGGGGREWKMRYTYKPNWSDTTGGGGGK
jgi:hypothetical protein